MIRWQTGPGELEPFCAQTPFGCKIASAFSAYGAGYPFARFWLQQNAEGKTTAAICKLDGSIVLDALEEADFTELDQFLAVCGGVVSCSGQAAVKMNPQKVSGKGKILLFEGESPVLRESTEDDPPPRELHSLLSLCAGEHFVLPPFEAFYLDLSHRYRHGAALASGVRCEDRLAACAIASAITGDMAVLSAVATLPEFRRQGLGAAAVRSIMARLRGKRCFVFRAEKENREFYTSLGFREYGDWAELCLFHSFS